MTRRAGDDMEKIPWYTHDDTSDGREQRGWEQRADGVIPLSDVIIKTTSGNCLDAAITTASVHCKFTYCQGSKAAIRTKVAQTWKWMDGTEYIYFSCRILPRSSDRGLVSLDGNAQAAITQNVRVLLLLSKKWSRRLLSRHIALWLQE